MHLIVTTQGDATASGGQGPGMQSNILQRAGALSRAYQERSGQSVNRVQAAPALCGSCGWADGSGLKIESGSKMKPAGGIKQGQGVRARCSLQKFCDSISKTDFEAHLFSKGLQVRGL